MITKLLRLLAARQAPKIPSVFGGSIPSPYGYSRESNLTDQLRAYEHFTYAAIHTRAKRIAELDFQLFKVTEVNGNGRAIAGRVTPERTRARRRLERQVIGLNRANLANYERGHLEIEEIETHPFLDIIYRPNPMHEKTGFILKERTEIHLCLTGNAFWLIVRDNAGDPAEFWVLRPDSMYAVTNKDGYLQGWAFVKADGSVESLNREDVVHFKMPAPIDDIFGWSMLKSAAYAHDTQSFMNQYHRNFFENSARPDYVLVTDQPIAPEQAKLILQEWRAEFSGASRSHLPAILGSGLTPKALQLTNTDIQFLGLAEWNLDQLVAIYGVPKAKLGLVADVNRSNSEAADATFNRETIRPEMLRIVETIQAEVLSSWDENTSWYDLGFPDPVPEDRQFQLEKRLEEFKGGIRTLNEARDDADLEPFPEELGDRIKIQMQDILVPVGASTDVLDVALGAPQTVPQPPGSTVGVAGSEQPVIDEPTGDEPPRGLLLGHRRPDDNLFASEVYRGIWWARFVARSMRGETMYQEFLTKEWRRQRKDLLAAVDDVVPARQHEGMAEKILAAALGEAADDRLVAGLLAISRQLSVAEAQTLADMYGVPEKVTALNEEIAWYLETKPIRIRHINSVTRDAIRRAVSDWMMSGEAVDGLKARILGATDIEMSAARAESIARTEANGALNAGAQALITEAGMPYKEWLSARDGRVRESHQAADGQVVRAAETFRVGNAQLRYPGDPYTGAAEEICNCRCAVVPRMAPKAT